MDASTDAVAEHPAEAYWTAIGNVVQERPYGPGGVETRLGTKHFAPGAKVYIIDWYAGGCARIIVVGLHRKSKKFIRLVIDARVVENLRPKVCYTPAVIKKIKEHYSPERLKYLTKEFAETICQTLPYWQAELRKEHKLPPLAPTLPSDSGPTHSNSFLARLWLDILLLLKN